MPWILRGLRNGVLTTRWPKRPDEYRDVFPGAIQIRDGTGDFRAADCPTGAITFDGPRPSIDRGRCILCGRCVDRAPDRFAWAPGADTARLTRATLIVPDRPDTDEAVAAMRADLANRVRRLRRSVHLRHVDAGSDGSDEWEIQALTNPVYDLHRLGIFFTASPRHADILLVTGIGTAGMTEPLRRTLDAMPRPTVVVAVGVDAISGGLVGGGYTGGVGIGEIVPVAVWVPGAPPSPFGILHGILLALGRIRDDLR